MGNEDLRYRGTLEEYGAFYDDKMAAKGREFTLFLYDQWKMHLFQPVPGTLVDLGCGPGGCVDFFARQGRDVTGVDIAASALAIVRERLAGSPFEKHLTTVHSPLETYRPEAPFDNVLCTDVLEHVLDMGPIFTTIAHCLAPDGLCYLGVPDEQALGGAHVRGVSPMELKEGMEGVGITVEAIYQMPNKPQAPATYTYTVAIGSKPYGEG